MKICVVSCPKCRNAKPVKSNAAILLRELKWRHNDLYGTIAV